MVGVMQRTVYSRGPTERGNARAATLVVVVALIVGAAVAIPLVLGGRQEAQQAETGLGAVGQANDIQAESILRTAIIGAQAFFAENGTFAGYGPAQAAALDPSVPYNTSPVAAEGQISIRGASATAVVLATRSASGTVFCVAAAGTIASYGRTDAASAAACTGGW